MPWQPPLKSVTTRSPRSGLLGTEFTTEEAAEKDPALQVGDVYEEQVENVEFGRIAAQTAKQVIVQKVREAERAQIVDQYRDRVGELLGGSVKKVTRDVVIVDLGNNAEGVLARDNLVGRETFRVGDRIRAVLKEIQPDARGPQLIMSRTGDRDSRRGARSGAACQDRGKDQ